MLLRLSQSNEGMKSKGGNIGCLGFTIVYIFRKVLESNCAQFGSDRSKDLGASKIAVHAYRHFIIYIYKLSLTL